MSTHDSFEKELQRAADQFEHDWRLVDEIEQQKARNELVAGCIVATLACIAIVAIAILMGGGR